MSKMVWLAVGAAGGIVAYKKVTRVVEDARERTLVGNVNAAAASASALVNNMRSIVANADARQPTSAQSPAASLSGWTQPRSDAVSSTSSPNGATRRSRAPR